MRNAMAILGFGLLALTPSLSTAEQTGGSNTTLAMAYVPGNPLMRLPGMNPTMTPRVEITPPALPQEIISNVSNAPNPFDSRKPGNEGMTRISYELSLDAPVRVILYDLMGFRVRRWDFQAGLDGGRAGENAFSWDGTNEAGQKVSKGGYLAQIEIETPHGVTSAIRKIGVIH